MISAAGCGLFRSAEPASPPPAEGPKSRIPFKTKEPENYQCEIVETAGGVVRRKRLAKKGNWRRVDFDPGEKTHRAILQTDREYIIDISRALYAETPPGSGGQFSELTHELLNAGQRSEFEETGREGSTVRYIVHPAESSGSEIVVHYDESIGMPIRQEFFSTDGGERMIKFTVEIVNFKHEPDADIFSLPTTFRNISMDEFLNAPNK